MRDMISGKHITAYKRAMRMILFSLLSIFISLAACTQDNYDKGEGEYSQLRADFVEAHVGADKRVDYVLTDDGDSLRTNPPFTVSWITTADTVYRALLYYNLKEGEADAYNLSQILVPEIKTASRFGGVVKTDPVHVQSLWCSRSGRYLNLRLRVMTGEAENGKTPRQAFGCVSDTLINHDDGHSTLHLRLYHNQNGQPEYYSREVYLSIPLTGVKADTIVMCVNSYDGIVAKSFNN